jgi:hypothetical protein
MGMDAGAAGVFGLYLPQFDQLGDLYTELQSYVKLVRNGESDEDPDGEPDAFDRISEYRERLAAAFAEHYKINVPRSARLLWTGSEDDRPARCDTPAEQWVLGWGLLTKPWDYPEMDASFRQYAALHEWVWMG